MKEKKRFTNSISIFGLFILVCLILSCNADKKSKNSNNENSTKQIEESSTPVKPSELGQNEITITELKGEIGQSGQWKSGWLILDKHTNFYKGDSLVVIVGGTAEKIVLRLLSSGSDPNSPSGIVGRIHKVNNNGEVKVGLSRDHSNVTQVSVHGGENPWDVYPLGSGNGAAFIQSVTLIR